MLILQHDNVPTEQIRWAEWALVSVQYLGTTVLLINSLLLVFFIYGMVLTPLLLECSTESVFFFQEFGKGGSSVSRCDLKQNLLNEGCNKDFVEFPISTLTVEQDGPLSDKASGTADDVTQIRPQKLRMTLRPGTFKSSHSQSPVIIVWMNDVE